MLRNLDAHAAELVAHRRFDRAVADNEMMVLNQLASAMHHSLACWGPFVQRLGPPHTTAFDAPRAGGLIIDCVFDELLDPAAFRFLGSAFELAASA